MRDGQGAIRVALAFAALLASLSLVISRQSKALAELRALDSVRSARAVAESERSQLRGRVQMLESRSRVLEVAGQRLGMRVPAAGREIVVLLRNLEAVDSTDVNEAADAPGRAVAGVGTNAGTSTTTSTSANAGAMSGPGGPGGEVSEGVLADGSRAATAVDAGGVE